MMSPVPQRHRLDEVFNETAHLKRSSTILNKIPNPVTFLKEYFQQLDYEEFEIQEKDDSISIGTHKLKKPFVEKPFDAENHEVCIYYPERDGGGRKILFRKKKDCCSNYEPHINNIRSEGNYVY